jgi:hypothetical protein
VTLTASSTRLAASDAAMVEARAEFTRLDSLKLEGFLEPALLRAVQEELGKGEFAARVHAGIGTELCLKPGTALGMLMLMANDPRLFEIVEHLTGCAPIACFEGRVYRFVPAEGHHDSWHSDVGHGRLIAMSINLGVQPYDGGTFQIRTVDSSDAFRELPNLTAGDAIMFRIDPRLRHRVTDVSGSVPKTAFAGWFRNASSFGEILGMQFASAPITKLPA